jgi:hypothetical protein
MLDDGTERRNVIARPARCVDEPIVRIATIVPGIANHDCSSLISPAFISLSLTSPVQISPSPDVKKYRGRSRSSHARGKTAPCRGKDVICTCWIVAYWPSAQSSPD